MQYDAYNCQQLAEKAQRVSAHAAEAAGAQDSQATRDAVATTAAIAVFWPAAFFVDGDKQNAAELARPWVDRTLGLRVTNLPLYR